MRPGVSGSHGVVYFVVFSPDIGSRNAICGLVMIAKYVTCAGDEVLIRTNAYRFLSGI